MRRQQLLLPTTRAVTEEREDRNTVTEEREDSNTVTEEREDSNTVIEEREDSNTVTEEREDSNTVMTEEREDKQHSDWAKALHGSCRLHHHYTSADRTHALTQADVTAPCGVPHSRDVAGISLSD